MYDRSPVFLTGNYQHTIENRHIRLYMLEILDYFAPQRTRSSNSS